jgi:hypothetical protein
MHNWKQPEVSTIHLANGEQVEANVNGIEPSDGSGYVMVHGREIKVMPLQQPWTDHWAEVLTIKRNDGSTFEIALDPLQLSEKVLIIDQGDEEVHLLCDAGTWREMTDQEYEQERRAWEADAKDMQQIRQEWRAYRDEGLGERG